MSSEPGRNERAVLAALEGIVRMQQIVRRGEVDVCVETGLVFLRVYYRELPASIARRLTELAPADVESIQGATTPGSTPEARRAVGEKVASDAAFAQAIRAANVYREKLGYGLLGPDGCPVELGDDE